MGQTVHPTPTASADFSQLCPRVFARNGPGGRPAIAQLIDEITTLIRYGVLTTNPATTYAIDVIHHSVAEAESTGRGGKVSIAPG